MRLFLRFLLLASCLGLIVLAIFNAILRDLWHQYSAGNYISDTFRKTFKHHVTTYTPPDSGSTNDKVVVMAKTTHEDTEWVLDELPDWQTAIYTVDKAPGAADMEGLASSSSLTTPANKGHEAMAYLTYIIDNYSSLPTILTFLHPHRSGFLTAWHTDAHLHSNVEALRALNLSFVEQNGYVNLRCNWSPGCREADRQNAHVTGQIWAEVFERTSTPPGSFPWPTEVGQTCCAQFAVTKDAVTQRPKEDYELFREWLLTTELPDRKSGRVFEFLWQVIFGKGSVYCPEEKMCYCQVYGRC